MYFCNNSCKWQSFNFFAVMEKIEVRAVIKFYALKWKSATRIKVKLDSVLENSLLSISKVHTRVTDSNVVERAVAK